MECFEALNKTKEGQEHKCEMFALHTKCLTDFKLSNLPVLLSVKVFLG